ncbi:hypothetical protein J2S00_002877 [Caldalkalibacillus uzonensis]|uniref:Uncharacterized protein n=1 Tax=Caldalkalibacillus uzonensis TaxID=353224 RepID=A0ABU0CXI1_9BACI|nr:FbpB family small basic protein [Caldalkalibacillus uzonensis]MDQ0340082.1 hypothetical protein [Caldalkalibacillus uzonensis]
MARKKAAHSIAHLIDQYKADILNSKEWLEQIEEKWEKRVMQNSHSQQVHSS